MSDDSILFNPYLQSYYESTKTQSKVEQTPVVEPAKSITIDSFNEIYVIGYPSKVGGADTELDHQIRIWQDLGLKVHLLHTGDIDQNLRNMRMEDRGCIIHEPRKWSDCKGKVVISYCNGEFLKNIETIRKYAKKILWVNCMCWLFPLEIEAHRKGMIDWFIYQTDHARKKVEDKLILTNPKYNYAKIDPYFHHDSFPFIANRPSDKFYFGRISRADGDKFDKDTVYIYDKMIAPVMKEGWILGVNDNVRKKIGPTPDWIKCFDAGQMLTQDVYKKIECFISPNGNYENLPRVAFEAMSSGSLLIVDKIGGWTEQVKHCETGFLCRDKNEFVYYSTRAAYDTPERKRMIQNARDWLDTTWGKNRAREQWKDFFGKIKC
jgi:glycosyltransferase involved in cell wall biosynthesis